MLFYKIPEFLQFSFVVFLLLYAIYSIQLLLQASNLTFKQLWPLSLIFISGYLVELLGARTGFPFGDYHYTDVLGVNLFDVPLVMSVAWLAVIINATLLYHQNNIWARALWVGLWAMLFDLVMDPVAVRLNFWEWQGDHPYYTVPYTNFVAWFVISALFSLLMPRQAYIRLSQNYRLFQGMIAMFALLSLKYQFYIPFVLGFCLVGIIELLGFYEKRRIKTE